MESKVRIHNKHIFLANRKLEVIKPKDTDIDVVDFRSNSKGNSFILFLHSHLFMRDNYSIALHRRELFLVISEMIEINKPYYIHNVNIHSLANNRYERLRSISIMLPGDNFFLLRSYLVQDKDILKIYLSNIDKN